MSAVSAEMTLYGTVSYSCTSISACRNEPPRLIAKDKGTGDELGAYLAAMHLGE